MTPTLLLTRPRGQNQPIVDLVRDRWSGPLSFVRSPLMEIRFETVTVPPNEQVILTSANGVTAAQTLGLADGRVAWCVGAKTAALAKAAGFAAVEGPGDAEGLIAHIISAQPEGRLAHIRGAHARGDVSARLLDSGLECADVVAYQQTPMNLSTEARGVLDGENPVILPLFSPRTATILASQGPFTAPLWVIAMSRAVSDALDVAPVTDLRVAEHPDAPSMADAIIAALKMLRRG